MSFFFKVIVLIGLMNQSVFAGVAIDGYPEFKKNEILKLGPVELGESDVQLVCSYHGTPTNWGEPIPNERHSNFDIQYRSRTNEPYQNVGKMLIQYKRHEGLQDADFGNHIRIRSIEIEPSFQRLGIGTAVLTNFKQYLQGVLVDRYQLEVNRHTPALRFYEKLGFKKDVKPSIYSDVQMMILEQPLKGMILQDQGPSRTRLVLERYEKENFVFNVHFLNETNDWTSAGKILIRASSEDRIFQLLSIEISSKFLNHELANATARVLLSFFKSYTFQRSAYEKKGVDFRYHRQVVRMLTKNSK